MNDNDAWFNYSQQLERRIAELEKENAELKKRLSDAGVIFEEVNKFAGQGD